MSQIIVPLKHPVTDEPVFAYVDYKMVRGEKLYAIQDGIEKFRSCEVPEVVSVYYIDDNNEKLNVSLKLASTWDDEIISQLFWETSK